MIISWSKRQLIAGSLVGIYYVVAPIGVAITTTDPRDAIFQVNDIRDGAFQVNDIRDAIFQVNDTRDSEF